MKTMKAIVISILAVIVFAAVGGCQSAAIRQQDEAAKSLGISQYNPDIEGELSKHLRVREEAQTLEELIAKAHPDFTWSESDQQPNCGGPLMLWIDKEKDGRVFFRLASAFTWKRVKNQPTRWVLLEETDEPRDSAFRDNVANSLLPVRIQLGTEKEDVDEMFAKNYAVEIVRDDKGGSIIEIGWAPDFSPPHGIFAYQVVVYVWKDAAGTWRLIGQGPTTNIDKIGMNTGLQESLNVKVRWEGRPLRPVLDFDKACELHNVYADTPLLVQHDDYMLSIGADGKPGSAKKISNRSYLVAEKDDTVAKIVERLSFWDNHWEEDPPPDLAGQPENPSKNEANHQWVSKVWKKHLLKVNPDLRNKEPVQGQHILLPTYDEKMKWWAENEKSQPTTAPATQPTSSQTY